MERCYAVSFLECEGGQKLAYEDGETPVDEDEGVCGLHVEVFCDLEEKLVGEAEERHFERWGSQDRGAGLGGRFSPTMGKDA